MARLPSVKATAPASASRPSSASSSPRQPAVTAPYGQDGQAAGLLAASAQQAHQGGIVDRGQRVGQGGERGDAAGRRSLGGRGDGFAILVAGLAEGGAHVDQPRAQDRAVLGDHGRAVRPAEAGAEIGDQAIADQQVAVPVEA